MMQIVFIASLSDSHSGSTLSDLIVGTHSRFVGLAVCRFK